MTDTMPAPAALTTAVAVATTTATPTMTATPTLTPALTETPTIAPDRPDSDLLGAVDAPAQPTAQLDLGALDEQLRAEAAARHRRAVMDAFSVVGSLSAAGVVLDRSTTRLGSVDPVEVDLRGRPLWEAPWWSWSPDVQDRLRAAVLRAASGESVRYGETVRVPGNMLVTVDLDVAPATGPDAAGSVVCSVLDLDAHRPGTDSRPSPRHRAAAS